LLAAGSLTERFGFAATASAFCVAGLLLTGVIATRWHTALWPLDAAANARRANASNARRANAT
jgi:hypothetical protein